jgi:hypothetical protein
MADHEIQLRPRTRHVRYHNPLCSAHDKLIIRDSFFSWSRTVLSSGNWLRNSLMLSLRARNHKLRL